MKALGAIIPSSKEVVCTDNSWSMHLLIFKKIILIIIELIKKQLCAEVYKGIYEVVLKERQT